MIRRQFIKLAALSSATGLASAGALEALRSSPGHGAQESKDTRTVIWHVRGFTCVTCAVGLETLLCREKGVIAASATYPRGRVTIQYHPDLITQDVLRSAIAELGFIAEDEKG